MAAKQMPECWGHRGASAEFPENTLSSFAQAIKDGADCIESDIHVTTDDVIVMFHDKTLDRTTNSTGLITSRPYYGENGIEHVRTLKEPVQQIPTFEQLCTLLMEPGNEHVKFNIDVKPNNDPARLFEIMARTVDRFPQSKERLHPRLILGLWHPKFIAHAKQHVPTLRRAHIGGSPADAIKYFWKDCEAFSIYFPSLVTAEGQAFIKKAQQEGKDVMTWTVNRTDEMVAATSWGLKAILTDRTDTLNQLRKDMTADYEGVYRKYVGPWFGWTSLRYYSPYVWSYQHFCRQEAEEQAGEPFAKYAEAS